MIETNKITIADLDILTIKNFNYYVKAACRNAMTDAIKKQNSKENMRASLYEDVVELAQYIDAGFDEIGKVNIPVMEGYICLDTTLAKAIYRLPEKQREVILLYAVKVPQKNIATVLGINRRTVYSYKIKAITALRKELGDYER